MRIVIYCAFGVSMAKYIYIYMGPRTCVGQIVSTILILQIYLYIREESF